MTWVVGWKANSSVLLIADTAGSSEFVPPRFDRSSVGEAQTEERRHNGYFVEESLLKLGHVARSVIVGYSGNTRHAAQLLKTFDVQLSAEAPIPVCFQAALDSLSERSPLRDLQIAFGFWDFDRSIPRLCSYNAHGTQHLVEHDEEVQIGSVSATHYPGLTDLLLSNLRDTGVPCRRVLALSLAICRSYGIFQPLMDHGVGGVFCGVRVDSAGVHWQDDMATLTYSLSRDGGINMEVWTKSGFRGDVLLISSSVGRNLAILSPLMIDDPEEWKDKCRDEIGEFLESFGADVYAFLSREYRTIVVVETNGSLAHELFKISGRSEVAEFAISPKLMEKLGRFQPQRDHRELTMYIDFTAASEPVDVSIGDPVLLPRESPSRPWHEIASTIPMLWVCKNRPRLSQAFRGRQFIHNVKWDLDLANGFGWHGTIRFRRSNNDAVEYIFDAGELSAEGPRISLAIASRNKLVLAAILNEEHVYEVVGEESLDEGRMNQWIYLCGEIALTSDKVRLSLWINGEMVGRTAYPSVSVEGAPITESILGASLGKDQFGHFDIHALALVPRPVSLLERWAITKLFEFSMTGRTS